MSFKNERLTKVYFRIVVEEVLFIVLVGSGFATFHGLLRRIYVCAILLGQGQATFVNVWEPEVQ